MRDPGRWTVLTRSTHRRSSLPAAVICSTVVAALSAAACGSQRTPSGDASEHAAACHGVDVSLLRSTLYDYEPWGSPAELYRHGAQDLIVSGTVVGFSQGPVVPVDGDPEFPDRYVVMTVDVDAVIRGAATSPLLHEDQVFIGIDQGPVDSMSREPISDIAAFDKAVPKGTAAILFVGAGRPGVARRATTDVPTGATLGGVGPQGLYLDDCGALTGGTDDIPGTAAWQAVTSLDALRALLTRLAA